MDAHCVHFDSIALLCYYSCVRFVHIVSVLCLNRSNMGEYYQLSRQVGRRIATTRQAHDLSAADLAERLHWSRDTLINYETGRRRLTVETLTAIAQALGIPPAVLLIDDLDLATLITALVREPDTVDDVTFFLNARRDAPLRTEDVMASDE